MRTSLLDFGKKYTTRVFIYTSAFLAFYTVFGLTLSLSFFGILEFDIPWNVYFIAYYDTFLILGIIFQMLKEGAKVNSYFSHHKGLLIKHKNNLWKVNKNFNIYKNKHIFNSHSLRVARNRLRDHCSNEEERQKYVEDAIASIDLINERLDYDYANNPLKLLGLK